ncbi:hypothetical protein J3F84DRAFT_375019 [Trichoderma pleuroticola]
MDLAVSRIEVSRMVMMKTWLVNWRLTPSEDPTSVSAASCSLSSFVPSLLIRSAYDLDRHVSCLRDFGNGKRKRIRRKMIGRHASWSADWMKAWLKEGCHRINMRGNER